MLLPLSAGAAGVIVWKSDRASGPLMPWGDKPIWPVGKRGQGVHMAFHCSLWTAGVRINGQLFSCRPERNGWSAHWDLSSV